MIHPVQMSYFCIIQNDKYEFSRYTLWRGLMHDKTPGLETALTKGMMTGYIDLIPRHLH